MMMNVKKASIFCINGMNLSPREDWVHVFVVVFEAGNLDLLVVVLELEEQDRMLGKEEVEQHHVVTFVAFVLQLMCSLEEQR